MSMKAYFLAGLAVEEAIERRERARANLRTAAEKVCPDEIRALDAASEALKQAETNLAHVMQNMIKGQAGEARAAVQKWAEDHAATCDNPACEIKQAVERSRPPAGRAN